MVSSLPTFPAHAFLTSLLHRTRHIAHAHIVTGNERHGVFRVPGDADEVSRTIERLNCGEFVLTTTDPFVVASVLIAWLAELPEPLIPFAH